jgi:hypothetical protein
MGKLQRDSIGLAPESELIVAEESGSDVHLNRPDVVVAAIR